MLTKEKILASVENVYDARFMRQHLKELLDMFYPFIPDNPFQHDTLGYEAYEDANYAAVVSYNVSGKICDDKELVAYMQQHAPQALAMRGLSKA